MGLNVYSFSLLVVAFSVYVESSAVQTVCPPGQIWKKCGGRCARTCVQQDPYCTSHCDTDICVSRCVCPPETPVLQGDKCIRQSDCPDIRCPRPCSSELCDPLVIKQNTPCDSNSDCSDGKEKCCPASLGCSTKVCQRALRCPDTKAFKGSACADKNECRADDDCPCGLICCSTGCGNKCQRGV
ncbi:WAP four-disulfide core domain protein 3 [Lingula anatina]|uniref:WAP four-disulfide core domain protein 3 n=1 Tax=Lingula anatina TaxID=7574 RepID=A0A1S3JMB3_LINAN|nr:WAP four-disulfide core domain protein 3 [Lingula anatina]|eukprot:XP_013411550.1 WAP four-disulfide core domain protein 3 [Lingula anatina]